MTIKEALAAGLVEWAKLSFPGIIFPSIYGLIDHGEWCRRERERFITAGRRAEIVEHGRRIALYVEPAPNMKKDASKRNPR